VRSQDLNVDFEKFKRDKSRIPGYHEPKTGQRSNSRGNIGVGD